MSEAETQDAVTQTGGRGLIDPVDDEPTDEPTGTPTDTPTSTPTGTPTGTPTATPTGATATPTVTTTLSGGGPAADVPTLSGWALVAMMLLLGTLGYIVASRSSG